MTLVVAEAAGAGAGAAGAGAAAGAGFASLAPHEAQKRFVGAFTCPQSPQTTAPLAGAAAAAATGGSTGAGAGAIGAAAGAGVAAMAGTDARFGTTGWAASFSFSFSFSAAGRTAAIPCGGVPPAANFFGAASRGNSAPQPRQNL